MTDEVYTLVERNRELKGAASGARHRVSGSRTSYVGLPSDHLTPAQLRKKNGPIVTLRLDSPMSYAEFRALNTEHQKMYIEHLTTRYDASRGMLAEMLGISTATLDRRLSELHIRHRKVGHRVSFDNLARWRAFLGETADSSNTTEEESCPESILSTTEEESCPESILNTTEEEQTLPDTPSARLRSAALTVENVLTYEELEPYMAQLLSKGVPATVRIEVSFLSGEHP